ncbi:MAG: adenine nucleotide alpha hydrolase [Rhodospirillaceae bacterium]|jgi:uncharacterized protein|nr:adenine nucleotide alpha hydrolase [Rhodospirillaceae bacterium]MBT3495119.1 adenine nucleotide alpha hydrolase [Rhodospirillaceae bacterium]MBT3782545.1 adenine nucleotide alpha hydrolase [Rhodospirillaceae bacterium]MBT3977191.1 adenine nucleotide alpha hydrolase [Rhodospirillaceae bacterium]MBT4168311.1 adenine nucleotide alpha hydrolase [Rhodospirillaceae bacterium]
MTERLADIIHRIIADHGSAAVAVSGGVDSMTLSSFSHRLGVGNKVRMIHAVSPAVPAAATARVRALAKEENWRLDVIDAGEFSDERYRTNPVNRCFYCKTNLYQSLAAMTGGMVLSGANMDDLGDYRPGLQAAANNGVRHPYVEAGLAKADVRALAQQLGLPALATLPASPCLASRVETGLRIMPSDMALIDSVETWLRRELQPDTVRCRVRHGGIVIELDPETLSGLPSDRRTAVLDALREQIDETKGRMIQIAAYRRGSAFVHANEAAG